MEESPEGTSRHRTLNPYSHMIPFTLASLFALTGLLLGWKVALIAAVLVALAFGLIWYVMIGSLPSDIPNEGWDRVNPPNRG